ncbi:MAG: fibronectin type III domain-containing protein [Betaproteobacteria bacterium]|nr:fibronectin type III domain-containing protein [Betaproteobacteria bacterium]
MTIPFKRPRWRGFCAHALLLAVLVLISTSIFSQGRPLPPPLFGVPPTPAQADRAVVRDPTVVRARTVMINTGLLRQAADAPGGFFPGGQGILFNLFDERSVVVLPTRIEQSERGLVWVGHLRDHPLAQVILAISGEIVSGNITLPGARYHIRYVGNGLHETQEIDDRLFPLDEPLLPEPASVPDTPPRPKELMLDDGSQIDVMVAYSATTRAAAGGTTAIQNLIDLAIAETNQSYLNSGIAQRLRLVHSAEVSYTESGDIFTDLNCVTNTGDGCIDGVHSLRDTYGADLVSLWVENGGGYCGVAWFMASVSTGFAPSGFSVVARSCATGYYSFGHELGHNMGARHDVYVDNGATPYTFAHGYTRPAASPPWRTVMAYNNACSAVGTSCTRIQYWSNPSTSYGGIAMGDASADNQQTFDNTAYTVANFRAAAASVPGAPGIGAAAPGDGSATVAFTPPASNGGASIDNYRVTCGPGGFAGFATASPITVTGLANGSTYTCTAAAHNSVGWGPESTASGAVTPLAPVQRAFVSAATGNDANVALSCAVTNPCRTFAGALPTVSPGGEIVAIHSGEYAAVVLNKSVTLIGAPGHRVSITSGSGTGISIATAGIRVTLRNLSIIGAGGTDGIGMSAGAALSIEGSVIAGFPSGKGVSVSTPAAVRIADTLVRDNFQGAYLINGATASIVRSKFLGNTNNGVLVGGNATSTTRAEISNSVIVGSTADWGISAQSLVGGATVRVVVSRCAISNSNRGLIASSTAGGTAILTVNRCRISGNTVGLEQSGAGSVLRSRGNNTLVGNTSNSAGIITPFAPN